MMQTSLIAWSEVRRTLRPRQLEVYAELRRGEATMHQVAIRLFRPLNTISGRFSELARMGMIEPAGIDRTDGHRPRTIQIPTPTVNGNYNRKGASDKSGDGLATFVKLFPTPRASEKSQRNSQDNGVALSRYVKMFPTPRTSDGNGPGKHGTGGMDLRTAVKYPTPRSADSKGADPLGSQSHSHKLSRQQLDATAQQISGVSGQLNPDWVEWLMGFPIGWTELSASETPSSRKSRKSSGAGLSNGGLTE